jgi:Rod binding domain-containing protein
MLPSIPPLPGTAPALPARPSPDLRAQAQALETAFLAEMLKASGMARMGTGLPGGAEDSPFEPFWAEAQARALMAAGGLGLTDSLVAGLTRRDSGAVP